MDGVGSCLQISYRFGGRRGDPPWRRIPPSDKAHWNRDRWPAGDDLQL